MPALSLDHYNVYCADLEATVRFYERYVGLTNGDRPPFPFPGAWMYAASGVPVILASARVSRSGEYDHPSWALNPNSKRCGVCARSTTVSP